jgi:hypothetical protein
VTDPANLTADELASRAQRLMTTLGERLTRLDREVLRAVLRRANEREGVVEALLDRNLQWGPQLERNRLLEEVAGAALALRRREHNVGRRLDAALGRLHEAPNPGRGWLAPEAVRLVREALQGVLDGLARPPDGRPVAGGPAGPFPRRPAPPCGAPPPSAGPPAVAPRPNRASLCPCSSVSRTADEIPAARPAPASARTQARRPCAIPHLPGNLARRPTPYFRRTR